MATYIPASASWAGSGNDGNAEFRFAVDRSYNAAQNKSTLTIRLQVKTPSGSGYSQTYNLQEGSISVGGVTKQTFTNDGRFTVSTVAGSWATVKTNGSDAVWTHEVTHNADGSASVAFSMSGLFLYRYASGDHYIRLSAAHTETASFNETRVFTLSISAGTGSTITVTRNGTVLSDGASLSYGDTLTISFTANSGYALTTHTVNGSTFPSGSTQSVAGNVAVVAAAALIPASGTVRIWNGTAWEEYQPYVYDNGWQKCEAYIYDNGWVKA